MTFTVIKQCFRGIFSFREAPLPTLFTELLTNKERYVVLTSFAPVSRRAVTICRDTSSNILTVYWSLKHLSDTAGLVWVCTVSHRKCYPPHHRNLWSAPMITDTKSHLNYNMPQRGGFPHNALKHKGLSKQKGGKEGELAIDQCRLSLSKHFFPPTLVEKKTIMWEVYILIKPAGRWLTKGSMICQYILRITLIQHHRTWELPTICFSWL